MGGIYHMGLEDNKLDRLMCEELIKYAEFAKRIQPALIKLVKLNPSIKIGNYDFGFVKARTLFEKEYSEFEIGVLNKSESSLYLRNFSDWHIAYFRTAYGKRGESPINLNNIYLNTAKNLNDAIHYNSGLIFGLMEFNNISDQIYNEFVDFIDKEYTEKYGLSLEFD